MNGIQRVMLQRLFGYLPEKLYGDVAHTTAKTGEVIVAHPTMRPIEISTLGYVRPMKVTCKRPKST